jgi:REP element-mobilizing transposase RayT
VIIFICFIPTSQLDLREIRIKKKMKSFINPLIENGIYHVYTRGIDKKPIFLSDNHFRSFLRKYEKMVRPYVDTFAFCLLGNHFHLLIRVKTKQEIDKLTDPRIIALRNTPVGLFVSRRIGNLLNSHAQMFNFATSRTGGLFESPFRRKPIRSSQYLMHLIKYIHLNPMKHEIYGNYEFYPYSSYREYFKLKPKIIAKTEALLWFGNLEIFEKFHETETAEIKNSNLLIE